MENLEEETKRILRENRLFANKRLGQNFLINDEIIEQIVKGADVNNQDLVIEIGPGLGSLTNKLLQKSGRTVCIELDNNMVNVLNKRFSNKANFEIIHTDVLKIDLKNLIKEEKEKYNLKNAKVVANLPYYITTPIIMKLLEERLDIKSITVMVQKEVAARLTEKPGGDLTGAITYAINYYTNPLTIFYVPRDNFIPAPEVDSAVIHLKVLDTPRVNVKNEKLFFDVIKFAFMQRRKTLVNSLGNSNIIEKDKLKEILLNMNLDERIRAQELTIEQFALISDSIENTKKSAQT